MEGASKPGVFTVFLKSLNYGNTADQSSAGAISTGGARPKVNEALAFDCKTYRAWLTDLPNVRITRLSENMFFRVAYSWLLTAIVTKPLSETVSVPLLRPCNLLPFFAFFSQRSVIRVEEMPPEKSFHELHGTKLAWLFVLFFPTCLFAEINPEPEYLTFQLMTGLPGYAGPPPKPGHFALTKAQLEGFVHEVVKAIGTTGDAWHKLGFAVGPLCLDMSDEETRQFIHSSFEVARENDMAVAFHIDDSICWGQRKDLLSNPDNIETADWKQIPNTGRRADWGPTPTKFPPQMCYNSPEIQAAVKKRASVIGAAVIKELDTLKASGKEHLFAGIIAGWETYIGRDFETDRPLGYRALSHRGFSENNLPEDSSFERVQVVKEFIETWANALHSEGIPSEKIFCHIAFTSQGLRAMNTSASLAEKVQFSPPEVAFSSAYRPGFSTYPEGTAIKEIHAVLTQHGSPRWISAEGTNVSPTGMPGEGTMETYLGRMFNHGAVMVNIFSWGMGGAAMRNNFFRQATENPEALAAYAKFLRHQPLIESAPTGFSSEAFQDKMHRIQKNLPGWVQKSGQQAQVMPLTQKLDAFLKDRKWQQADKVADEIISLMSSGEKNRGNPD